MPNQRISELIEKIIPVANDLLPIVDSAISPIKTKKIKYSNLVAAKVNSIPPGGFVKVENIYLKEADEELVLIT